MSVSIAEEEVKAIGPEYLKGHYAAGTTSKPSIIRPIKSLLKPLRKSTVKAESPMTRWNLPT
jgi:hypothetical protein